jgi:hypothetical protein
MTQGGSNFSAAQEREIAEWKKEMAGAAPLSSGGGGAGEGGAKVHPSGHAPKKRIPAAVAEDDDDYADDQFEAEF